MNRSDSDPKLLYQRAEELRKANKSSEAQQQYLDTIKYTQDRTEQRNQATIDRAGSVQTRLKVKLAAFLMIPVILAGAAYATYRYFDNDFAEQQAQTDPKTFLFVEWLTARQTKQVLSNLVQANPNLSFDFSNSATALTPTELLESMTSAGMQERFRQQDSPEDDKEGGNNTEGDGSGAFQCSLEPATQCNDMPTASGVRRNEIELIVNSYRAVLDNEKDCAKVETSIQAIGTEVQWRRSEIDIKSDLESVALRCFSRQENYEKAIEYSRKMQCSGDLGAINSSYWHLTANYHKSGDIEKAKTMYSCFRESVAFIAKTSPEPWRVASGHRESGALAWLYFNDLDTAVNELEAARNALKKARDQSPLLRSVAAEVDLDLMETYVTANIDPKTFAALHNDINNSGLLTDGYKQIKDALAGIYYLQNNNNADASIALGNVAERFRHLPEYICDWDWSGFQRGLNQSIKDPIARQKADQLVVATDCYVKQTSDERIAKVRDVLQWLKR